MSQDPTAEPTPVLAGEMIARLRANAIKAKRARGEPTYRCPSCADTGWTFRPGTTEGGHRNVECAHRCHGPTASGCLYDTWRRELRVAERPRTARDRRMDD